MIARSNTSLAPDEAEESSGKKWFYQHLLADGSIYLRWLELFEFIVSADGRNISGRTLERPSSEVFSAYLLAHLLSFALLKQGIDSLHASAVVVNGYGIGFFGDSGRGKSTLVASFLSAGYKQLTDDLLLLEKKRGAVICYPGPPRIKLLAESAALLGKQAAARTSTHKMISKKVIPLEANQFQQVGVPLRALYLLAEPGSSQKIKITSMHASKALLALISNAFNISLKDPRRLKLQFEWATEMISTVAVKQIAYPRSLEALPEVRTSILADMES